jgi:hypothetical protein
VNFRPPIRLPAALPPAAIHVCGVGRVLPPKALNRDDMRPLWHDLILKVWGGDPLECPCCKSTMKPVRKVIRHEEIEFFLRLHGLWAP